MNNKQEQSVDNLLKTAVQLLHSKSDTPSLDCEVLLLYALNTYPHGKQYNRAFLRSWLEYRPKPDQLRFFEEAIKQRINGKPVAYITGQKEFWSLNLQVNEHTLIPRPDTEVLVEQTLSLIPPDAKWNILDLGTGSGAIALAIASERKNCLLIATDKSYPAIEVARANANSLKINNCLFINSSWLNGLADNKFHIIVSNPPYIKQDDNHLKQLKYEPITALTSEQNGLKDIKHIIKNAGKHLQHPGYLLLEHGYDQAKQVKSLLEQNQYTSISQACDYNNIARVSIACNKQSKKKHL